MLSRRNVLKWTGGIFSFFSFPFLSMNRAVSSTPIDLSRLAPDRSSEDPMVGRMIDHLIDIGKQALAVKNMSPYERIFRCLELTKVMALAGDLDGAKEMLDSAKAHISELSCPNKRGRCWCRIARAYSLIGEPIRAKEALNSAVQVADDESSPSLYWPIAEIYASMGAIPEALNMAECIQATDSDYGWCRHEALRDIARWQFKRGDRRGAIETVNRATGQLKSFSLLVLPDIACRGDVPTFRQLFQAVKLEDSKLLMESFYTGRRAVKLPFVLTLARKGACAFATAGHVEKAFKILQEFGAQETRSADAVELAGEILKFNAEEPETISPNPFFQ